tara:strand:+ start:5179 stop:7089 length:1911 start_codon:yes stop_codon:yes gene_type:complete
MNSRLNVLVGAKIQGLEKGLKKAQFKLRKFGRAADRLGSTLNTALTLPMVTFGAVAVKAFDKQAKAEASLRTALKGNEDAFRSLTQEASKFQELSLFGDEEIIQQQSYLASLGMTEDTINKVIAASIDLASGTGQTLEFGVKNLAKTFAGLTGELGESIPMLKTLTTEELKAGAAVEVVAKQFEGQGRAIREAGIGSFEALKNKMMDFAEVVGGVLVPMFKPLEEKLKNVTHRLSKLNTEQISAKVKTALYVAGVSILISTLGKLALALNSVIDLFGGVTKAIPKLLRGLTKIVSWIKVNPYLALAGALASLASGFLISSVRANRFTNSLKGTTAPVKDITKRLKEINSELENTGKNNFDLIRDELNAKRVSIKEQIKLNEDLLNSEESLSDLAGEAGIFESMMRAQEATQKIKDLNIQLEEIDTTLKNTTKAEEDFNKGLNTTITSSDELANSLGRIEEAAQVGIDWNAVYEPLKSETVNATNLILDLSNTFSDSFVNLFFKIKDSENAVMSFGAKFSAMAKQFLEDIGRMIAKAAIFAAAKVAISAAFGVPTAGFGSIMMAGLGVTGMATGGSMTGGRPYLVGEHGAELVIPSGNSHIQSASQTATMGIPDVRISGEDLIIVFDRAMRHRNTLG